MQINADFVKAERQKRAWSQEQLAVASGLGLRTIQRLEATGVASNETAKCLAAVFDCRLQDLRVQTAAAEPTAIWRRSLPLALAASVVLITGISLFTRAVADEVMIDVVLNGVARDAKVFKLLTHEGQQTEAQVENRLRILVTPTLQANDLILLTAEIYGYDGNQYKLLSKPKVVTRNGIEAKIQIKLDDQKELSMYINPKKIL